MKTGIDVVNAVEDLMDLSWGYRAARVLQVANNLDIFTIISDKKMTLEQICQRCNTKPEITEKLLIACTAMNLLKKQGSKYKNNELARTYLIKGGDLYQGNMISHSASVWNFWSNLENEVRMDSVDRNQRVQQADDHKNFILGMHNIAVAGRAQLFLDGVDLTGRKKLFDVGGGPGTYSIEACKRYPDLKAVVFDLPETVSITKEIIANEQMEDRVTVLEGSWDTHNFGEDNDVVLLSDVMHGPGSRAPLKLTKAYNSMTEGGLLVVQEFLLNNEKTGSLVPALFNIMVGAYSEAEMFSMIEDAGFLEPKVVISSERLGATWVTARKP
jgi:hypothetical protein